MNPKKMLNMFFALIVILSWNCGGAKEATKTMDDVEEQVEELKKDGWKVFPGEAGLKTQLTKSIDAQSEMDEKGMKKYYMGSGTTVGRTKQAAKSAAAEFAWISIIQSLGGDFSRAVESDLSNNQIDNQTSASITKFISSATNLTKKKVGPAVTLFTAFRELPNGNTEVQVNLGYSVALAKDLMLQEMQNALTAELANETGEFKSKVKDYLFEKLKDNVKPKAN